MDIFSANASKELFAEFPQWRDCAKMQKSDDGTEFLVLEIPAPSQANVEYGLIIDTENEEVTVGFDHYHSHFDSFVGDGAHFGTRAALEFIKQILEERVVIVSWWENDTWRGSAPLEAGSNPVIPDWATPSNADRIRVRSWHGSFNQDTDA